MNLYSEWIAAKEAERQAVEERRRIEDLLCEQMQIDPNKDNTITMERDGFKIKVSGRISRKIDAEKVYELAVEHGLEDQLNSLFRWKPEINMSVWKASDARITSVFAPAITATPGRPSFSISQE